MGKIIDTTNHLDTSIDFKSKVTKNFNSDNYFIKSHQEILNKRMKYAPNVVDIEEGIEKYNTALELEPELKFSNIEVRITSAYDESGKKLTDDYKKIIFSDMKHPMRLGKRYRFDVENFLQTEVNKKSIWMNINYDSTTLDCSALIRRCNGTLGFLVNNNSEEWYEPALIDNDLKNINNYFNHTVNVSQSEIYTIVQYNKYTQNIAVSDRFIIGAISVSNRRVNTAYKVKAVVRIGAKNTFESNTCPFILIALDKDVISDNDLISCENGVYHYIADYYTKYNNLTTQKDYSKYYLKVNNYEGIIYLNESHNFTVYLYSNEGEEIQVPIDFNIDLKGTENDSLYYDSSKININTLSITNLKMYLKDNLIISCSINEDSIYHGLIPDLQFEVMLGGVL